MCKRISIFLLTAVLFIAVSAQKSNQHIPARANVVAYSNDDDIPSNAYTRSPYYLQLSGNWKQHNTDTSLIYSRQVDVEKTWKDYVVCLNVRCGKACRVYVNGKAIGYADDSRQWNEFELNSALKYGKVNTIEIEAMKKPQSVMVEDPDISVGLAGTPFILFKSDPGIVDFSIASSYDNNASTGILEVACQVLCSKRKGKYYLEIELLDPKGHRLDKIGRWVLFSGKSEETVDITRSWAGIQPWTAETPTLYTAIIRLRDQDMQIEETVGSRVGFRTVGIQDGKLCVNGKPIILKSVSYGCLNSSVSQMEADIKQMKRNNVNAVHTSKYSPLDARFYELCDRYGLYVIPDANILPSSKQGMVAAVEKRFAPYFEQRVENLYASLKNNPSIIAWSLGSCIDNGFCINAAYKRMKQLDNSRPTLSLIAQTSDLDPASNHLLAYQWPLPQDSIAELKQYYSPIIVKPSKITSDQAEFIVENTNSFRTLSNYSLQYTIYSNIRNNIISGDLPLSAPPQSIEKVSMLLPPNLQHGEQLYIRFDATERASNNNRVYSYSIPLEKSHGRYTQVMSDNDDVIRAEQDSTQINISSPSFSAIFDITKSTFQLQNAGGSAYILNPPAFAGYPDLQPVLMNTSLRSIDSQAVSVDISYRYPDLCDLRQTITVLSSADMVVDCIYDPQSAESLSLKPYIPINTILRTGDTVTYFGADRNTTVHQNIIYGQYSQPISASQRLCNKVSWATVGTVSPIHIRQIDSLCAVGVSSDQVNIYPVSSLQNDGYSFRIYLSNDLQRLRSVAPKTYVAPSLPRPVIAASSPRFSQPMTVTISSPIVKPQPKKSKPAQSKKTDKDAPRIYYTVDGSTPTLQSPLYEEPIVINRTTIVKAAVYAPNMQNSFVSSRYFNFDHIVSTSFSRKPNTPYNKGTDTLLFDGNLGSIDDLAHRWLGFSGNPPVITVQLAQPIRVHALQLRFAHSPASWIFAPLSVEITLIDSVGQVIDTIRKDIPFNPLDQDLSNPRISHLNISVDHSSVKTIVIAPKTIERIPDWHRAKGLNPWLLMDEIEVTEDVNSNRHTNDIKNQ